MFKFGFWTDLKEAIYVCIQSFTEQIMTYKYREPVNNMIIEFNKLIKYIYALLIVKV